MRVFRRYAALCMEAPSPTSLLPLWWLPPSGAPQPLRPLLTTPHTLHAPNAWVALRAA